MTVTEIIKKVLSLFSTQQECTRGMISQPDIFPQSGCPKVGPYFVGLVDILGQKNALKELSSIQYSDAPEKFALSFIETWRPIQRLRRAYEETYNSFSERRSTHVEHNYQGCDKDIYEYYSKVPIINFQGFSDLLTFHVDLTSSDDFLPTSAIYVSLVASCAAISTLLACGHAIRGGADVACGGVIYENEIYGPALLQPYELESKMAYYPRILIGEGLVKYLQSMQGIKSCDFPDHISSSNLEIASFLKFGSQLRTNHSIEYLEKYINLIKKDAEQCLKLINIDTDRKHILDYFGDHISQLLPKNEHKDLFKMALNFAKTEKDKFHQSGNFELYPKYVLLSNYLESRTAYWL